MANFQQQPFQQKNHDQEDSMELSQYQVPCMPKGEIWIHMQNYITQTYDE